MKVIRVFNNNALLADAGDVKKVIIGKGIAFGKKAGDIIEPGKDSQVYIQDMRDPQWVKSLVNLVDEVPIEYIAIAKEIIQSASRSLKCDFNPFLDITLADHIYFAVKRSKKESDVNVLDAVKTVYPAEFSVAEEAVNRINIAFNVNLASGEASLIAIHFVENELTPVSYSPQDTNTKISVYVSKVLQMVIRDIGYPSHSSIINRMSVHLRYLINNAMNNEIGVNNSPEDSIMLKEMLKQESELSNTLASITTYFYDKFSYKLSTSERLYLLLHLRQIKNSVADE